MIRERGKKIFLTDLIFSKFFLIFCIFLFFVIFWGLAKSTIKNYHVDSEIKELQEEISRLDKQNQEFTRLIEFLRSEVFIEQEAKLKLGLKKPGENLVIIPQEEMISNSEQNKTNKEVSNLAKWWAYFFK